MAICLKCRKEYSDEISKCPDCDVYLVDFDGEFTRGDLRAVKNVGDFFEANAITSLLNSVGIETFTSESEYGATLKLYTGNENFYGKDIYVESCFYDIAKEIIDAPSVEEEEIYEEDLE
ncbi:MAG: hypothetical protein RR436_04865 [Clostridia bacterium]